MDRFARLEAGIKQARPVIAGAATSTYDAATPCPDWDVRGLINNMLGALTMFRDVANTGSADPALFARDLIGADALSSFDTVAHATFTSGEMRGEDFASAVEVSPDAPAIDRLVGYLGRRPAVIA